MRLKTKLVVAITGLVFLVVTVFSWLYLSQLLEQHIEQSYASTDVVAHQLLFATRQALETGLRNVSVDPNDPEAVREAVATALREDHGLNALVNSVINYSPTVLDIAIADKNGKALVSAPDPTQQDQLLPKRLDSCCHECRPRARWCADGGWRRRARGPWPGATKRHRARGSRRCRRARSRPDPSP